MSSWSSFEKDKVYTDQWRSFLTESDEAELILEHGVINENALQRFMNVMKGKIKVINKKLNDPVAKAVKDTQKLQDEIEELQDQIGRAKAQIEAQGVGADPASLRPLEQLVAQLEAKLENKRNPQQGQQQGQQGQSTEKTDDPGPNERDAIYYIMKTEDVDSLHQRYKKALSHAKIRPEKQQEYSDYLFSVIQVYKRIDFLDSEMANERITDVKGYVERVFDFSSNGLVRKKIMRLFMDDFKEKLLNRRGELLLRDTNVHKKDPYLHWHALEIRLVSQGIGTLP